MILTRHAWLTGLHHNYMEIENMIYVKEHEKVLAVCDSDLIGKEFREGKLYLKVSERFYKGCEVSVDELKRLLKGAVNVNIAGNKSVQVAIDLGLVKEGEVKKIEGVSIAQFIVL